MVTWTNDELIKIGTAEELQIRSLRRDGSLRNPVTVWVILLNNDLYVRSVNGRNGAWFRGTQVCHEGRILAGGIERAATFVEEANPAINDQIDTAYRTKYRRYATSIVNSVLTPQARAATIKLVPHHTGA